MATVNDKGKVVSTETFDTSEHSLIRYVKKVPAKTKSLIVEESSLAGWIHRILSPHVDELVVCDPKHNALISRGNKNDVSDAVDLCRLYRLGEYVEVYHGDDDHRNDFKIVVKEYMDIGNDCTRLKSKITAKHRQAGIVDVQGTKIFNKLHHEHYLKLSQQRCEDSSFNGSTTVWTVRKPNERRFSRRSSS
ncbi:MAG: transposase [Bacteroidetes bacterium]|nr:transposase [Bacteroidota bacterium]